MARRLLGAVVLAFTALASGCSTLGAYPDDWHDAQTAVHVYGSLPECEVELPTNGQQLSLLDLIFTVGANQADLARVMLFRRDGDAISATQIDVREMVRRGDTTWNVQLQPGDVVGIPD